MERIIFFKTSWNNFLFNLLLLPSLFITKVLFNIKTIFNRILFNVSLGIQSVQTSLKMS